MGNRPYSSYSEIRLFVKGYVEDLALGLKAAIMLLNPGAHRDRRR